MPAAAVKRRGQVLLIMTGCKGYVGGWISGEWNKRLITLNAYWTTQLECCRGCWYFWWRGDILRFQKDNQRRRQVPSRHWHWGTEAWVSNRIRDPSSPRRQRWVLHVCFIRNYKKSEIKKAFHQIFGRTLFLNFSSEKQIWTVDLRVMNPML